MSHVTGHRSNFFDKVVKLVGGGFVKCGIYISALAKAVLQPQLLITHWRIPHESSKDSNVLRSRARNLEFLELNPPINTTKEKKLF